MRRCTGQRMGKDAEAQCPLQGPILPRLYLVTSPEALQTLSFISALLTMPKPLTVWITINCGNSFLTWETIKKR